MNVRSARETDAAAIAAIYAPYVTGSSASFETEPPDAAEMAARLAAHPTMPWLVAVAPGTGGADDALLGYAYASPHRARAGYRWSVETSVYVAEPGRGTGVVLTSALLQACASAGFESAYAGIALPSDASVALHERLGFRQIGVFPRVGFKEGRWIDVGWWYRPLAPGGGRAGGPAMMHRRSRDH